MRIIAVELAKRMKMTYPNINVIFSTGYDQYRGEYMSQYSWAEFKHSSLQSVK